MNKDGATMQGQWRFSFPGVAAARLYDIAADVESYPDFLPGCVAARVTARSAERLEVENVFGMGFMRVKFRTDAFPDPPERLRVTSDDGPWRRFELEWRFVDQDDGAGAAELSVTADFRSPLLAGLAGGAFARLEEKLVAAFQRRLALMENP
jgi:coenzyme Q-binding protein COQ10